MPASLKTRRAAARRAARRLMRSGLDCGRDLTAEDTITWLADIAQHIDSLDRIELGAAALLESSGYQRTNEQLALAPLDQSDDGRRVDRGNQLAAR